MAAFNKGLSNNFMTKKVYMHFRSYSTTEQQLVSTYLVLQYKIIQRNTLGSAWIANSS